MAGKSKQGYLCPCCGRPYVFVKQTVSFSQCIFRTRKCLLCGYTHDSCEVPVDPALLLREAMQVLVDNIRRKEQIAQ